MADQQQPGDLQGDDADLVNANPNPNVAAIVPAVGPQVPAPAAAAVPANQQQLLAQLAAALMAQAQANPGPLATNSSPKHVACAPDKYMGNGRDRLTPDEFLTALQLFFMASKTPRTDWAVAAATHVSSHMQTLMFSGMSLDAVSDSAQYTWDDFTVRFKQVAAMGQLQTDLQVYDEISTVRCNMYERCNTPAILHRIESLWPKMLVQPADGTKIYLIWRALHPELRMQMAIDPSNQQQWSTYSTFRQHLVSKAPHFDATVIPAPHPHKRHVPPPPARK